MTSVLSWAGNRWWSPFTKDRPAASAKLIRGGSMSFVAPAGQYLVRRARSVASYEGTDMSTQTSTEHTDTATSVGQVTSVLIGTHDVDRLRTWYAEVLPPQREERMQQYRVLDYHGFWLFLDPRDDVPPAAADPHRFLLNIEVDDATAVARRADSLGTTWVSPLEDRDGSLFGTMQDPDGNAIQIIQLSDAAKKEMAD
ncbi:VOC family protein [Flexivirga alba]|uniref:VOC family protein n=1 Tax=Flexivirga alba TaxID=702742 RepID=A0ABW2AD69_9MICO